MKRKRISQASFVIIGYGFVALSLLTGCAWSAEGPGFRVNSPPDDSYDENFADN